MAIIHRIGTPGNDRTTDGTDIEFPFHFWATTGTEGFATMVQSFFEDVEVDVDFRLVFVSGSWCSQ